MYRPQVVVGRKIVYTQPSDGKVKSHPLPNSEDLMLTFPERAELVQHLLLIPSIIDLTVRATMIDQLPTEIKTNIRNSLVDKTLISKKLIDISLGFAANFLRPMAGG